MGGADERAVRHAARGARRRVARQPGRVRRDRQQGARVLRRVDLGRRLHGAERVRQLDAAAEERRQHEPRAGAPRPRPTATASSCSRTGGATRARRATSEYRVIEFERYAARIESHESASRAVSHKSLPHLGAHHETRRRVNLGELLWRVGVPVSALMLVLLAIPMSFVNPRAGRSVNLLFALLHLHRVREPAQREPGARRAGAHGLRRRHLAGARGDDRAAGVHVRAPHADHPHAPRADDAPAHRHAGALLRAPDLQRGGASSCSAFSRCSPSSTSSRSWATSATATTTCARSSRSCCFPLPAHAYELFPIAVLIGTLVRARRNSRQFRVHGDARLRAVAAAGRAGRSARSASRSSSPPSSSASGWRRYAEETAQKVKLRAMSSLIGQGLESGLWFKDEGFVHQRARGAPGQLALRRAHLRVRRRLPAAPDDRSAQRAEYRGEGRWTLHDVVADALHARRAAHRAHRRARMALGGDARHAGRADRASPSACRPGRCTSTPSTSPATGRRPSATRSRCGRSCSIRSPRW